MKSEKKSGSSKVEKSGAEDRMQLMSQIWGKSRRMKRLNEVVDADYCGKWTVREFVCAILADRLNFPKGLDTPLSLGDFEGNWCQNVLSVTTGGANSDHVCLTCDPNGYMD